MVVALLLVIGVGSFLLFGAGNGSAAKLVTVQSVIGQTPQAAEDQLTAQGLVPQRGEDTVGPCTGGQTGATKHVCTTKPTVGAQVKAGTVVVYNLYTPKLVQVPSVVDEPYDKAATEINNIGLTPVNKPVLSSDAKGTVESQSPTEFTRVAPGSDVTLMVSTGTVKLPDVVGMNISDARATLSPNFKNVGVHLPADVDPRPEQQGGRGVPRTGTGVPDRPDDLADRLPVRRTAADLHQRSADRRFECVHRPDGPGDGSLGAGHRLGRGDSELLTDGGAQSGASGRSTTARSPDAPFAARVVPGRCFDCRPNQATAAPCASVAGTAPTSILIRGVSAAPPIPSWPPRPA